MVLQDYLEISIGALKQVVALKTQPGETLTVPQCTRHCIGIQKLAQSLILF